MPQVITLIEEVWNMKKLVIGLVCVVGLVSAANCAIAGEKPNIVLILSEDHSPKLLAAVWN